MFCKDKNKDIHFHINGRELQTYPVIDLGSIVRKAARNQLKVRTLWEDNDTYILIRTSIEYNLFYP